MTYIPPHLRSAQEKDRLLFGSKNQKILNGTFKERKKCLVKESDVHLAVCKFIKLQFPKVLFLSDFAAGMKMTKGMANRQAMLKSNDSFPDLMILERDINDKYNGLFLELKRDHDSLYTKSGQYIKSEHIENQLECLHKLRDRGYKAEFSCGVDESIAFIRSYLTGL